MRQIFIGCLMFLQISCSLRIEKDIATSDQKEAVNAILYYLDTLSHNIHYNNGPPFKVRQTLSADTMSCMYYKCNLHYYYLYINTEAYAII
ncbi:MAG: hypothetical protein IPH46_17285 [Bacteroidetes bacterium]|nr:hypothetical protein [Bacteroidota bacterium]